MTLVTPILFASLKATFGVLRLPAITMRGIYTGCVRLATKPLDYNSESVARGIWSRLQPYLYPNTARIRWRYQSSFENSRASHTPRLKRTKRFRSSLPRAKIVLTLPPLVMSPRKVSAHRCWGLADAALQPNYSGQQPQLLWIEAKRSRQTPASYQTTSTNYTHCALYEGRPRVFTTGLSGRPQDDI